MFSVKKIFIQKIKPVETSQDRDLLQATTIPESFCFMALCRSGFLTIKKSPVLNSKSVKTSIEIDNRQIVVNI